MQLLGFEKDICCGTLNIRAIVRNQNKFKKLISEQKMLESTHHFV